MNIVMIQNAQQDDKNATVTLSRAELETICRVLHKADDAVKDRTYFELYEQMIIARELCRYGHIDAFALSTIIECKKECGEGLVASKEEK